LPWWPCPVSRWPSSTSWAEPRSSLHRTAPVVITAAKATGTSATHLGWFAAAGLTWDLILIRVLPRACFRRIASATCANDLPLETTGDRCEPLGSAGMWTKRGPGPPRSRGQRCCASRTLAGKVDPAGCPDKRARLGDRLVRGSPGGVWARDIPLYRRAVPDTGMVIPSTLGVQTVRTTMTVLKDRLAAQRVRDDLRLSAFCGPCFGHSRELWFFGLLRTFLNGWAELAEASWACSWRWQRRPPPQPHQGHGGGALPSGMTALDVPPEQEGRRRGRIRGCVLR
jgi:hypothetical protein